MEYFDNPYQTEIFEAEKELLVNSKVETMSKRDTVEIIKILIGIIILITSFKFFIK